MMTLSGVRSSCDMVDTNSDLSALAWRASSRSWAFRSAMVACSAIPPSRCGSASGVAAAPRQELTRSLGLRTGEDHDAPVEQAVDGRPAPRRQLDAPRLVRATFAV